jgi:hypothetical protein
VFSHYVARTGSLRLIPASSRHDNVVTEFAVSSTYLFGATASLLELLFCATASLLQHAKALLRFIRAAHNKVQHSNGHCRHDHQQQAFGRDLIGSIEQVAGEHRKAYANHANADQKWCAGWKLAHRKTDSKMCTGVYDQSRGDVCALGGNCSAVVATWQVEQSLPSGNPHDEHY